MPEIPPVITLCDFAALAAQGAAFNGVDKVDAEALKVYLLALLYKEMTGIDLTNICDLAASLKQYDSLPDYAIRSAELQILVGMLEESEVEVTEEQARAAIACSHCCTVTPRSLEMAEWCLWHLLTGYRGQGLGS